MTYIPTNWKSGDIVTSTKLNKLEQGVESIFNGTTFTAYFDHELGELDKTWQEIHDAYAEGKYVNIVISDDSNDVRQELVNRTINDEGYYEVHAGSNTYIADTANSYPRTGK